jgi:hypothetical protein
MDARPYSEEETQGGDLVEMDGHGPKMIVGLGLLLGEECSNRFKARLRPLCYFSEILQNAGKIKGKGKELNREGKGENERSESKTENIKPNNFARFQDIIFICFYLNKNDGGRVLYINHKRAENINSFI